MLYVIPIAKDNDDAMKRVGDRLEGDVGTWMQSCIGNSTPFWAIARSLFPVAESLAWLLHPEITSGSSERLSTFLNTEMASINPEYAKFSHILCQIWRHGLTHGDEPPLLVVNASNPAQARAMGWKVILPAHADHLTMLSVDRMNARFSFSLESFFRDLLQVCRDPSFIKHFPPNDVAGRYNSWTIRYIDKASGTQEERKAAAQILTLLA